MLTWKYNILFSASLAYGPFILTNAFFRMIAHAGVSSAFFLPLLTPTDGKIILLGVVSYIQSDIGIIRIQLV